MEYITVVIHYWFGQNTKKQLGSCFEQDPVLNITSTAFDTGKKLIGVDCSVLTSH
jgi:hypothetical protein